MGIEGRLEMWGGEPYAQPYIKLNALQKRPQVRFDWTEHQLKRVQRWVNGRFWKYADFADYNAGAKTDRRPDERQLSFVPSNGPT